MGKNTQITVKVFETKTTATGESIVLNAKFKIEAMAAIKEAGDSMHGLVAIGEKRLNTALSLLSAFEEYKVLTGGTKDEDTGKITGGNGLPAFAVDVLGLNMPRAYGKPGTTDRDKVNKCKEFTGLRYLLEKVAKSFQLKSAERKALEDAGINPDSAAEVTKNKKEERDLTVKQFQDAFNRSMIGFDTHGVTEVQISNFLITVLKKRDSDLNLSSAGKKICDAAIKAVFEARGKAAKQSGSSKTEGAA